MENKMFCFQCQETAGCTGCTRFGVCGKTPETAALQDLLIYVTKGLSAVTTRLRQVGTDGQLSQTAGDGQLRQTAADIRPEINHLINRNLFTTITNANFDPDAITARIQETLAVKGALLSRLSHLSPTALTDGLLPEAALWEGSTAQFAAKAAQVGIMAEMQTANSHGSDSLGSISRQGSSSRQDSSSWQDSIPRQDSSSQQDIRSLRELITYGLKGLAAYTSHANALLSADPELDAFLQRALAATLDDRLTVPELTALALDTGEYGVKAMALLDQANTSAYGNPEMTKVNLGTGKRPGILVSGHDLRDLEMLLEQSAGKGVDIYTHSEMLPAHYYPAFKKYPHLAGNYGNAWWKQKEEFEQFGGPILMTTNCIVPPKASYRDRLYTTGAAGFPGCPHIPGEMGEKKDFTPIIQHALRCAPPKELEQGEILGGFAHAQVLALADQIIDAVKSGAIKKFVVMAGCDGRAASRSYYTNFAKALPEDTVILTAGCAKYRYNKLQLGTINGIPRVLDAGQCNDSYSLAVIALKLKEIFGLEDINQLPIIYNISWYEQKAVIVLLALLYLGVKNIHLGPTLPAFLSPNVARLLVEKFGISGISTVEEDMKGFFGE